MANNMYLSLGTAMPGADNTQFHSGKTYPVLVFALSDNEKNAEALAIEHMQTTGWSDVRLDKTDPVDVNAIRTAQAEILNAYKTALDIGSHGMVIGKPE